MGLIFEEVEIGISGKNAKYYEGLGYTIPRRIDNKGRNTVPTGSKISVKVEHLPDGSHVKMDIKCDCCGDVLKNITWKDYISCLKNGLKN